MLEINRVNGLIGITTKNAKQYIEQPHANIEIEHQNAKLIMHSEMPKVLIDQQQCFNESGLKDYAALTEEAVQLSKQAVMEGIARRASEGDRMAAINIKADAVGEIAFNNSFDNMDFNIAFMPQSRPKIEFTGNNLDIQVEEGHVNINVTPRAPIIDVEVGGVEISMKQHPELHIRYIGENIDQKV